MDLEEGDETEGGVVVEHATFTKTQGQTKTRTSKNPKTTTKTQRKNQKNQGAALKKIDHRGPWGRFHLDENDPIQEFHHDGCEE